MAGPGMEFDDLARIDRATWRRYLFYIDLAVFLIFAVSLALVVRHTYQAGQLVAKDQFGSATRTLWFVVTDTAFLVGSLSWIVYRFFRNQYLVLTRRF